MAVWSSVVLKARFIPAAACLACCCAPAFDGRPFGATGVVWGGDDEGIARLVPSGFGTSLAVGDVTGDGIDDLFVGAPRGGKGTRFGAGDIYLIAGPIRGEIDLADRAADATFRGQTPLERAGVVLGLSDMNGDGVPDLIVATSGTPVATAHAPGFRSGTGVVRIIDGTLRGEHALEPTAMLTVHGAQSLGASVLGGDYNGDGHDDLICGAPLQAEVYVIFGPRSGTIEVPDEADVRLRLAEGSLGMRLAGADVDNDGKLDLLMDAASDGRVYLVPGGLTGEHFVDAAATAVFVGDGSSVGESLAIGDLTGDGVADFAIASQRPDDPERADVHVIAGPVAGEVRLGEDDALTVTDLASWTTPLSLLAVEGFAGFERALVVGAYVGRLGGLSAGAVWAFDGSLRGRVSAAEAQRTGRAWTATAEALGTNGLGFAIAAGDTDGDGQREIVATAPSARKGGKRLGAVLVFEPGGD